MGSSWASGIVTLQGQPNRNGRNQESSAEAINAYEAIALYGATMAQILTNEDARRPGKGFDELADACRRIDSMGRLLLSTELRSAHTYWQVRRQQTPDSHHHKTPLGYGLTIRERVYPGELQCMYHHDGNELQ